MNNIKWLDTKMVLAFHTKLIQRHGGLQGIRDNGLLNSALARPQQLLHYSNADISQLAASYAYGIAKNHPFVDGNKRVAISAAGTFLAMNGHKLKVSEPELVIKTLQLAASKIGEKEFAEWIEQNILEVAKNK